MQSFTKPSKLNGEQLLSELSAAGIIVDKVMVIDDKLFIDSDLASAKDVVAKHVGVDTNKADA
jgi:hypothetical protein